MKHIRLGKLLQDRYPSLTKRQIEEAFDRSLVTLPNGKRVKKGDKGVPEIELETAKLDSLLASLKLGNPVPDIQVVREELEYLVINKPPGVQSHPISLFDRNTVTQWLFQRNPELAPLFFLAQPTVVPHRLDFGTSGLLLVAKSPAAYEEWRGRFSRKEMRKKYLAWCWGKPSLPSFEIEWPIAHAIGTKGKMTVVREGIRHKPPVLEAKSSVSVLKQFELPELFLAEVSCATGVTHQVRVHLSSLGYPLLGDTLYDPEFNVRSLKPKFHELCAISLSTTNWEVSLEAGPFRERYPGT